MNFDSTVYVGFWRRFAATLIDTVAISLVIFPILYLIYGSGYFDLTKTLDSVYGGGGFDPANARMVAGPADALVSYLLPILLILGFWVALQATPGKMLFAARIVDANTGGKPTTGQYLLRYIGYFVSMIPFFLGFLWVAFDPRKQGWHDKIARTVVVRPGAIPPPLPPQMPPPLP